jgi:hypothetical protein
MHAPSTTVSSSVQSNSSAFVNAMSFKVLTQLKIIFHIFQSRLSDIWINCDQIRKNLLNHFHKTATLPLSLTVIILYLVPWKQQTNRHHKKHSPISFNYINAVTAHKLITSFFLNVYLPRPVPGAGDWPKVKPDVVGLKG